jgi:hypothetical protein
MSAEVASDAARPDTHDIEETRAVTLRRRTRLAWMVLGLGLLGFCVLCVGVAFGVFAYAARASVPQTARLERENGNLLEVQLAGHREWRVFTGTMTLTEGDAVRTGPNTSALITLFDDQSITVHVFYSSEVKLATLQASRYADQERQFVAQQQQGVVTYSVGDRGQYALLKASVTTDQARIALGEHSTVRVNLVGPAPDSAPYTQVVLQQGRAVVLDGDVPARAELTMPDYQVRAYAGGTLRSPEPASEELFVNGGFAAPPEDPGEVFAGWQVTPNLTAEPSGGQVITHTETVEPRSVELSRSAQNTGAQWVLISQDLHQQQVGFYRTLTLKLLVKVVDEPPDTNASGPYPLTVRLHYYDQDGQEHTWEQGFYYDPAGASPPAAPDALISPLVKKGAWQERAFDLKRSPQGSSIARLGWFEVMGNGKQFSVWVSGLSLVGQ